MLARKWMGLLLACMLCTGAASATEVQEGTALADELGIVADKVIPGAEGIFADAVASGGEETRTSGENEPNDSQS